MAIRFLPGKAVCSIINEENGWIFVTVGKKAELFTSINKIVYILFGVTIITLILAILISLGISSRLVKPIAVVDDSINQIASGNADLTKRIEVNSNDEVGNLGNGFNRFIEKLQTIISQIQTSKGFAVVADEIRKLSETSTVQSKRIGAELNLIVQTINRVVEASTKSKESFDLVSSLITDTDELVRTIRAAMEEQQEGSKQILESLQLMNNSTLEVKTAGQEMKTGNEMILSEIQNLQNTTLVIKESMTEMSAGAEDMNRTGAALSDITSKVRYSIQKIGAEIDQFKA